MSTRHKHDSYHGQARTTTGCSVLANMPAPARRCRNLNRDASMRDSLGADDGRARSVANLYRI